MTNELANPMIDVSAGPPRRGDPPRWRRSSLVLILAAATMLASVATPAGSQGGPTLGDGQWRVVFFLEQRANLGGVDFDYSGHGSAFVALADGSASGEWNLSLATQVVGTNGLANGEAIGTVSGDSTELVLDFTSITATDASIGMSVTFTADELPPTGGGRLVPGSIGCSAVIGDWTIPFNDTQLEGEFIAQRLGVDGGETDADLRDTGLDLIEQARAGTIDVTALRSFIQQAESGSEETARADGCSDEMSRTFGTAATLLLNAVLVETGYAATDLDDAAFMEFYRVVLRSGLFEMYPDTRLTWEFGLLQRLADAISSEEPRVWRFWLPIAEQLGEVEAAETLTRLICDERGDLHCEGLD